jgi:hypothetical protein
MTTVDEARTGAPWHFWVVALLGLLWNGFGAVDYTMSHLQGEAWYRTMGMPEAAIAAMNTYPTWMHAVWAIGVWGSALGAVLLILRSRWAMHAFAVSLLGAIGNLAYTAMTPAVMEAMGIAMPLVIIVICLFLIWYARTMTARGVLR